MSVSEKGPGRFQLGPRVVDVLEGKPHPGDPGQQFAVKSSSVKVDAEGPAAARPHVTGPAWTVAPEAVTKRSENSTSLSPVFSRVKQIAEAPGRPETANST